MVKRKKAPGTTRLAVGRRVYELVPFHKEGEGWVTGKTMMRRAKKLSVSLGHEDCMFIFEHQDKISQDYFGLYLIFTAWCELSPRKEVAYLSYGNHWDLHFLWISNKYEWDKNARLVRRVK